MTWEPVNLGQLEERPPVQPTLGGGIGLVYPGKQHVFSGPQESAKTLAAYAIALAEVRTGGIVVLIDFEMGQWDARDRLRELDATTTDFASILYIAPDEAATTETASRLLEWAPTLVIIDAAAGAYDLQGLDDTKRSDVERFARLWLRTFRANDVATIVLDHVVKNADNRGSYAIGSERKVAGADVHLGFQTITPLSRGGTGRFKIVTHKDRGGWLRRGKLAELEIRSDPDTHALSWEIKPAEHSDDGHPFRPTHLMQKVSEYVASAPADDPPSRNTVESNISGKREFVRQAMDALVDEGYLDEVEGARKARLLRHVKPYREPDDPAA